MRSIGRLALCFIPGIWSKHDWKTIPHASLAVTHFIGSHQHTEVSYLPSDLKSSRTTSLQKIQDYFEKNAIFLDTDPDSPLTEGINV